ncbi:dihydrofolate reductase [Deinococcus sp. KSM4-11]|uniref:dihydrofolate reductase family protein n=1 Tax=Deinococcus sp. KSM4-11 TaxID=2568654 RepID=UPI0010A54B07|nr:dihydrofolate reductase family protein [Deinococcus sp. KSM4-11]THF85019.1 dihydrofolate reductase [Deinococcus sp. KSM4-11]
MGRLIISEFLSLDGVIDTPSWSAPYWNDEIAAFKASEMETTDALLQGRVTYDGMAAAWPARGDDDPGAAAMNSLPKYVVSTTLTEATWNNSTIIRGDVAHEIQALKDKYAGDILVYGSGQLTRFLLERGLVDQLNLLVYPVTVGGGNRLFEEGALNFTLTASRTFSSGVVLLQYQPAAR